MYVRMCVCMYVYMYVCMYIVIHPFLFKYECTNT